MTKYFSLLVIDTKHETNESGGIDISNNNHRGLYTGESEKNAIEWFKTTLPDIKDTDWKRSTVSCNDITKWVNSREPLPENKAVILVKEFAKGVLIGIAAVATCIIIKYLLK